MRCDAVSPPSLKSGRSIRICTAGFCFLTFPDRCSHACSVEPPHPAEPPNAVTRSRRKYHSGVARIGYSVFKVPGAYKPLYLSNGQKKRGWPTFLAEKNIFLSIFLRVTKNGGVQTKKRNNNIFSTLIAFPVPKSGQPVSFQPLDRICSSPITATINAILDGPEKNIFFNSLSPSPITATFQAVFHGLERNIFLNHDLSLQ